ncbi:hydroxymethylglutaryl-CoA reductase (NADPH) [Sphaceloma murrayae]|uniref:3-hydroxy-3-methylglutaryl coenzyme A reductase n=1 Tax=Sphaceloma murrayae TaxID=2082308 RepID=A0A2K1QKJ0_9PEZI|nr:hydroxymethylglutaryl-CoA reductase (NADPH) [Sphaceloma murrayae]
MLGSSLIPARWRAFYDPEDPGKPGWYNRQVTPFLQSVSKKACTHPIHTITFLSIVASSMYIGLLETGLFEPSSTSMGGKVDVEALQAGARRLHLGPSTEWKWKLQDSNVKLSGAQDLSLVTLNFANPGVASSGQVAPDAESISISAGTAAEPLPPSADRFSALAQETSAAFSVPSDQVADFLSSLKEISAPLADTNEFGTVDDVPEQKKWIMKAVRATSKTNSLQDWVMNSWTAFVDLLKNADTLDIIIMALGYLAMHLTFVSLFLSMRRMGSNFWLATSVLFSSAFAFLFGLMVTIKLGVPINVILLSEGLPFLVVTVGFEKPIILTQAVLSAAISPQQPESPRTTATGDNAPRTIQNAVQAAVQERGFGIVRDYAIEIAILCVGAASGIQGGLRQFCFLAAWTMLFDCILLFTFYTSILTIKLEVNRIKRHVALRKALEEDGVSRTVAENVASSNDWPKRDGSNTGSTGFSIFGRKARDSSVPRFKVLMVSGFILINVLNLCTMPFRHNVKNAAPLLRQSRSSIVPQPPLDPFRVASSGLDHIYSKAVATQTAYTVSVLQPIKYELQYPSIHYSPPAEDEWNFLSTDYADGLFSTMGGKVVEGVLKSFEDPVLSKWVIIALAMSLALNGYLFNAARWSIKEPDSQSGPAESLGIENLKVPVPRQVSAEAKRNGHAIRAEGAEADDFAMEDPTEEGTPRSREDCELMVKDKKAPLLNDDELIDLSLRGKIPGYALEKTLEDKTRAVKIRRAMVARTPATKKISQLLESSKLPYEHFDYDRVFGACCENVIGYMPLPVGVAGPLTIDGENYYLPMATTEGVLVASTSRGCKAINAGGGAVTVLIADGMTRGPCVGFETLARAAAAKLWLDSEEGQKVMKEAFNSTSRFARLSQLKTSLAGTYVYIRFKTTTGDAMGMNMISKGVEKALNVMVKDAGFEDMAIISVSGNFCTDKKPAAINWIDGRGKSVVAEAIIPGDVVRSVLKSDVNALVELNTAKNLIGSAMAGSIGGFNAHAANIVAAMFLACGQDPAQVVESANCITVMKNLNGNLQISVSMPSIEVGTIGGGTILEPQAAMLDLLGVRGAHPTNPGDNSRRLARVIAAGVLAGELSLCSALAAGHLVRAHMAHNRSAAPSAAPSRSHSPKPGMATPNLAPPSGLSMTSRR